MESTNLSKMGECHLFVIYTLIDGLRITDQKLNDKCLAALNSIGGRTKSRMRVVLDQAKPDSHRQRLADAIELIGDCQPVNTKAATYIVDALFDALRVYNVRLNEKAVEALSCLPGELANELIAEAFRQHKKNGYCSRLLRAADKVEGRPEDSRHIDLFMLGSHKDKAIQQLAWNLLWKFRAVGSQSMT